MKCVTWLLTLNDRFRSDISMCSMSMGRAKKKVRYTFDNYFRSHTLITVLIETCDFVVNNIYRKYYCDRFQWNYSEVEY